MLPQKTSTYPTPGRKRLYLLGEQHRRRVLSRVKLGRYVILMTADELREISEVIEQYARERGTTFGFVQRPEQGVHGPDREWVAILRERAKKARLLH